MRLTVHGTGDPLFRPTLILLGAAVVPVALVAFVSGRRRLSFGVRGSVVGLTALLGGVVGVLVAGALEDATVRSVGDVPTPLVGLIEEFAKLLVPAAMLLLFRRDRHPADGLLLGGACGAGFAVLETMGYALVALVGSGGNASVVNGLLLLKYRTLAEHRCYRPRDFSRVRSHWRDASRGSAAHASARRASSGSPGDRADRPGRRRRPASRRAPAAG